jgi:hypothetical protein
MSAVHEAPQYEIVSDLLLLPPLLKSAVIPGKMSKCEKCLFVLLCSEAKETEFRPDVTVVYVVFRCVRNLMKEDEVPPNLNFNKGLFGRREGVWVGGSSSYFNREGCNL